MALKLHIFLLLFCANLLYANSPNEIFYQALYSNSLPTIDAALVTLESEKSSTTNSAYKGALLMKKSGFMKTAAKKVEMFKQGHQLLEAAIKKYPQNVEYRFIRLTIQENAPKILKYNKDLEEDKVLIIEGYKKMPSKTRSFMLDYAQQSTVLTEKDLK